MDFLNEFLFILKYIYILYLLSFHSTKKKLKRKTVFFLLFQSYFTYFLGLKSVYFSKFIQYNNSNSDKII